MRENQQKVAQEKIKISWCGTCHTPIFMNEKSGKCPLCKNTTKYMCSDMRPVFPEERLFLGIIQEKSPDEYMNQSVWASGKGRYYIDGKPVMIDKEKYNVANAITVGGKIKESFGLINYEVFDKDVKRFVKANEKRLAVIKHEGCEFIREAAELYSKNKIAVTVSGGKDSIVTADLVSKALGNPSLVFVFGDTTLEFESTYAYMKRFKKNHPKAIVKQCRNNEKDFYEVCEDIGVPTQHKRWCCTMFKTTPVPETFGRMFGEKAVLTFGGIRAAESTSRSKYERIAKNTEHRKVQQQIAAYPIFHWIDADVWLYILSEKIDFNDAYRLGFKRVGCWLCPNSTPREVFLHQVYTPKKAFAWREQLIAQAKKMGKKGAENYVDSMAWTLKVGGDGFQNKDIIRVKNVVCATEEYANIYELHKPLCDSFYDLFTPLGLVSRELGRKMIQEVLVLDSISKVPIISIQPYNLDGYQNAVKIKTMNVKSHFRLNQKIVYQIRKYNACRECGKCASVCSFGAIKVKKGVYTIDKRKCTHCQKCISTKYINAGCTMYKVLSISTKVREVV